ncbi:MAG: hypothetical protein IH988_00160 [Planctomycetes bacterium]|nr:hypothetical protein [Planctomycetota bacterium]
MRRVLLFVLGMMLVPAAMGCRDRALGDSYPMALEAEGRPLLPTTERTYDARIMEGTAQAIGLQGDDGVPSRRPDRKSAESSRAGGPFGAIRDAFRNLNEVARKALGGPQPDKQGGDPDSDDSNQ